MANENSDINDFVKKCKILLLDIEGTTTSISFVKDKLFPYAEENVKGFLDSQWEDKQVQEVVAELRKLAIEDQEKALDGVVTIPGEDASKEDQIEGLVKSVKWQMASDRKVGPLKRLQGLIWKQGYDKGEIKGHVYEDVSPALDLWRSAEGHKVYIYSSGSVQAQKLLFGQSSVGDLLPLIDGHFDTAVGAKQDEGSYKAIAEKIGCKPEEILFLTDILKEAEAARSAGLSVALVSREGNAALPDAAASFPLLYSLEELAGSKRRRPDPQDEQPAKVPKTDIDDDVKTSSDPENSPETVVERTKEEIEKMEVEDETTTIIESVAEVETIVEEVTDTNEVVNVPVYDAEPVVEENIIDNKTDKKETEKMDTDSSDLTESVSKPKEDVEEQNGDKVPFVEETPPTIITEISDITQDNESLSEVAEIIEDLEPIVEEPTTVQDIELQNVGDVLEKECDEILSKVQDVTNLDNIPLKPLLSTIAEETMETDNTDTNDIVDGILDSEQEIEIRQRGDSDLNTVASVSETKTVVQEGKGDVLATDKFLDEKLSEQVEKKAFGNIGEKPAEREIIDQNNTNEAKKIAEEKVENKENTMSTNSVVEIKEVEGEINVSVLTESQSESTDVNKIKDVEQNEEKFETEKNIDKAETSIETERNFEINPNLVEAKANDKIEESETPRQETGEKSSKREEMDEKTEDMDVKTEIDAKMGEIDVKIEEIETKMEEIDAKTEDIYAKTEKIDANKEEIDAKTEEMNVKIGGAMVTEESKTKSADHKAENQENKTEENVETKESPMGIEQSQVENKETSADHRSMETDPPAESKIVGEDKTDSEVTETQVNGKSTNDDAEMANLNGETCKDDELSSRLSLENGKEEVNGANGDVADETKGQDDISTDTEVPDIKVKTVGTDEPCNDPIEQPTKA